jgi:hypothetical protein
MRCGDGMARSGGTRPHRCGADRPRPGNGRRLDLRRGPRPDHDQNSGGCGLQRLSGQSLGAPDRPRSDRCRRRPRFREVAQHPGGMAAALGPHLVPGAGRPRTDDRRARGCALRPALKPAQSGREPGHQGAVAGESQSSDWNAALSLGAHGSPHGVAAADGCRRHTSVEKGRRSSRSRRTSRPS